MPWAAKYGHVLSEGIHLALPKGPSTQLEGSWSTQNHNYDSGAHALDCRRSYMPLEPGERESRQADKA